MSESDRDHRPRWMRHETLLALDDLERIVRDAEVRERQHFLPDVERLLEVIPRSDIPPALRDEQAMVIRSYAVMLGLGGGLQVSRIGLARARVRSAIEQLRNALAA